MVDRVAMFFCGLVILGFGYRALSDRCFYNPINNMTIDLGQYHIVTGLLFISIGVFMAYAATRKRGKQE